MAALSRLVRGGVLALAGLAYSRAILDRNRALRPTPVRDIRGRRLPESIMTYSDGARVTVIDAGEGVPMLWIPGADGNKETFEKQLPYFAERSRVVCADLRSEFSPDDDFDCFARDVLELIDTYDTGPVVLVGQSLGTAIAMRFAYQFPQLVRGIVLANPLARVSIAHVGLNRTALIPVAQFTTRYLPTTASWIAAQLWSRGSVWIYDNSPGRDDLVIHALWSGPRTVRASLSSQRVSLLRGNDLRPSLPAIEAPALVVKGTDDTYTPPEWALEIASLLPNASYAPIPDSGHCCHISMPGSFNRLVSDWLVESVPGAAEELRHELGEPVESEETA